MRKIKSNNLSLYKLTDDKLIILGKNANLQLQAKLFINNIWSKWINLKKSIKGTPMLCVLNENKAFVFISTLNNLFYYSTLSFNDNNIYLDNPWTLFNYDKENMPTFTILENNSPNAIYMFTINEVNEACYKIVPFDDNYVLDLNFSTWININ